MDILKTVAVIAVVLAVYLNWPKSPLPSSLYEWRFKGDYYTYKDYNIFYRNVHGSILTGPTLVCLHGFPSSSYDWAKILPQLRKKFSRIILLDFIGFGFSDKPVEYEYSLMDQADLVEVLLTDLGINSYHLLSHDYGDTVAQEIIHRHDAYKKAGESPYEIHSLCLLNGGMFPETNFPSFIQRVMAIPTLGPVLSRLSSRHTFRIGFSRVFGPYTQPTESELWDFWTLLRVNDGNLVVPKLLGYMSERRTYRDRWTGALQNTAVPIHTIYGPADVINPPHPFIEYYKKTLPRAGLTVLDKDVGHYPQWEAPSAVLTEYYRFLDRLGATEAI